MDREKKTRRAKFEIFPDKNGVHWYWHLVGGNGEVMNMSEDYVSYANSERGIRDYIEAVAQAAIYLEDDLKAANEARKDKDA